jgi:hypothetical protein
VPAFVRAGSASGLLAAAILILNGGWSALVIACVAGAGAGLLITAWEPWRRPRDAVRLGLRAGLAVGVLLLLAQLFRDTLVVSLAALPLPPLEQMVIAAGGALLLASAAGAVFGGIQALPSTYGTVTAYGLVGVFLALYPVIDQAAGLGNIAPPGVSKWPIKMLITSTSQLASVPNSCVQVPMRA